MNAMHRRSAWVSAAVLLGLAGTASATEHAWHQGEIATNQASNHAFGADEMGSIPVERLRPLRVGERRESIAVERVSLIRAADLVAVAAMGTTEPELMGSTTMPEEPAPSHNNPHPFDRSALVPTGSRWVEGKKPTIKPAPSSRFAGLVLTPMPGSTPSVTPHTTAAAVAPATPAPVMRAPQAPTPIAATPIIKATPITSAPAVETPVAAQPTMAIAPAPQPTEPTLQPTLQPTIQPTSETITAVDTGSTPNAVQTGTGFATMKTGTQATQTSESPTSTPQQTQQTEQTNHARLASMFPAPEGWGAPRRLSANGTTPNGWDLIPTPLPIAANTQAPVTTEPITTGQVAPMMAPSSTPGTAPASAPETTVLATPTKVGMGSEPTIHRTHSSTTTRDMMPDLAEVSGFVTHHSAMNEAPVAPATEQQPDIGEPASGMSVRTEPTGRTSRGSTDSMEQMEGMGSSRTRAILDELARKSISQEDYEDSLRRLSARRQGMDVAKNQPLMAGDRLGVSIARSAGYVD